MSVRERPKDLAVVTMVYDDTDYLRIWLGYWRSKLPQEHLYVLVHGGNPELEAMADGTNVVVVPRPEPYPEMEEDRWKMLSDFVAGLLEEFRVVVYTDVDELLVTDPADRVPLVRRLAASRASVAHPVGLEMVHRGDLEPGRIDPGRPVMAQRNLYRITSFHSKPCIVTAPVKWGRGGHFVDRPGIRFLPGVFCIHLRFYDEEMFLERGRRRRETTKAPEDLDKIAHRRWRTSEAGAVALIETLRGLPVRGFAPVHQFMLKLNMKRKAQRRPDALGLYRYRLYSGKRLHRFPASFSDLF